MERRVASTHSLTTHLPAISSANANAFSSVPGPASGMLSHSSDGTGPPVLSHLTTGGPASAPSSWTSSKDYKPKAHAEPAQPPCIS